MTTRRTYAESTELITRVVTLQNELLDYTGHVNRGMSRARRDALIAEVQEVRTSLGWRPLNMAGRLRRQKGAQS